jgi:hypothetical protein
MMAYPSRNAQGEYVCEGTTLAGRRCRKVATAHWFKGDSCAMHYCAQHSAGAGAMRILLPRPWEYDRIERGRM